jgi:hypothetical protein
MLSVTTSFSPEAIFTIRSINVAVAWIHTLGRINEEEISPRSSPEARPISRLHRSPRHAGIDGAFVDDGVALVPSTGDRFDCCRQWRKVWQFDPIDRYRRGVDIDAGFAGDRALVGVDK